MALYKECHMTSVWKEFWRNSDNAPNREVIVMASEGIFRNTVKGGIYYGFYTDENDKRKQFSTRTRNEREANRIFKERVKVLWEKRNEPQLQNISLSKFRDEYIAHRKAEKISTYQVKELESSLRFLQVVTGDIPLQQITVRQCEKFIVEGYQPGGWKSLYSPKKHYQNLSAAFKTAVRWKLIKENPFSSIKKPRPIEEIPEYITWRELSILCDSISEDEWHGRRLKRMLVLVF